MHRCTAAVFALLAPAVLAAQSPAPRPGPDGIMLTFERFADNYGGHLVAAFDSIPAAKYDYRPTPAQQTIGYIAQHVENANYGLCGRLADLQHPQTAKDALPD